MWLILEKLVCLRKQNDMVALVLQTQAVFHTEY